MGFCIEADIYAYKKTVRHMEVLNTAAVIINCLDFSVL